MESTLIVTETADRVEVRINRPGQRNAINQAMVDELHAVCALLENDPKILIVAGSEGVFASGADIAELRERRSKDAYDGVNSRLFDRIARLPIPLSPPSTAMRSAGAPSSRMRRTSGSRARRS